MKKINLLFFIFFLVGCSFAKSENQTQINVFTPTPSDETPLIVSPTMLPKVVNSAIPNAHDPETKLINQCVKKSDVPPASNSIIVLRSLKDVVPRQAPDIILVDMSDGKLKETNQKINITPNYSVSPNGELIAYLASTIINEEVAQLNLIVANGDFQTQYSTQWDDSWSLILGWTTDQKVIISSIRTETSPSIVSYILVDPRNGSQQNIKFNISDFQDESLYDVPYWESWYGVLMNPTHNLAVYPKQSNANTEMYTYALWDVEGNSSIFSLEEIFSSSWFFIKASPMPSWSSDGNQFVFVGGSQDESPGVFELFIVHINGDIKQLTNLTHIGYIWPSLHSWSPDNKNIVFFMTPQQTKGSDSANVSLVNTDTLDVIDLCLSIGLSDTAPIWSPDEKHFLVVDKYENDHQQVLLVDIENDTVFPLAEDAEPIGWMVIP